MIGRKRRLLVALVLLVFLPSLLSACGAEDESATTVGSNGSVSATTSTSVADDATQAPKKAENPPADADVSTNGESRADRGKPEKPQTRERTGSRPQDAPGSTGTRKKTPPKCLPGLSREQCAALAAVAREGGGTVVDPEKMNCPKGIDSQTCDELTDAISTVGRQRENGTANRCLPGLSERECRELAESLGG